MMFALILYTRQVWFTSKVRYNGEKGEYKRGVQTTLKLANPLGCAKSAGRKATRKKPISLFISTLLQDAWDISSYPRCISVYNVHAYTYARTHYIRSTARPCLADHPHPHTTLMQRRLFCRGVKYLMAKQDLKKDQGARLRARTKERVA